jgi:hypothetical protein
VDHVVFEDVKTLRSVLVTSLQTVIRTQKEQEFYVVKNLLKAEEWLSENPSYNLQNLKWLKEVTEISGILFLDANLNVVDAFPPNPEADSILLDLINRYLPSRIFTLTKMIIPSISLQELETGSQSFMW